MRGFFSFFCRREITMASVTTAHNPSSVWTVPQGFQTIYSHATEVPAGMRILFISGQFGVAGDGSLPPAFSDQVEVAMNNVEALLASAGMTQAHLVKLNYYLTRPGDAPTLAAIRRNRWSSAEPPAVTAVVVSSLARPDYLIEIEAIAAA
jgi:2-iminobutanoate/2-iminopropanoate deaminase